MFEFWGQLVDAICRPPRRVAVLSRDSALKLGLIAALLFPLDRDSDYTTSDLIGGETGRFKIACFGGKREDLTLVRAASLHGARVTCMGRPHTTLNMLVTPVLLFVTRTWIHACTPSSDKKGAWWSELIFLPQPPYPTLCLTPSHS